MIGVSPFALIALVTKMRPPHTIGLESDSPGRGVLKRTFVPFATSQVAGTPWPSPTPDACGPRNCGHGRAGSRAAAASRAGAAACLSGAGSAVARPKRATWPARFTAMPSIVPARPQKRTSTSPAALSKRRSAIGATTSSGAPSAVITRPSPRTATVVTGPLPPRKRPAYFFRSSAAIANGVRFGGVAFADASSACRSAFFFSAASAATRAAASSIGSTRPVASAARASSRSPPRTATSSASAASAAPFASRKTATSRWMASAGPAAQRCRRAASVRRTSRARSRPLRARPADG